MRRVLIASAALALATLGASAAGATNLIQNGDFATGDFTDWSLATTAGGVLGNGLTAPGVVSFDVTGNGAQNAAHLQVGDANIVGHFDGGSLSQAFTTAGGQLSFYADYAVMLQFPNAEAGRFIVQIDGVTQKQFDLGSQIAGTIRGSILFDDTVAAGSHTLSIFVERPFLGTFATPQQYLTNISLDEGRTGVPEPASWALMIAGFGLAGARLRRRARVAA
jgi:hypothetical protein